MYMLDRSSWRTGTKGDKWICKIRRTFRYARLDRWAKLLEALGVSGVDPTDWRQVAMLWRSQIPFVEDKL